MIVAVTHDRRKKVYTQRTSAQVFFKENIIDQRINTIIKILSTS
jgi:hypothetical protein